MSDTEAAFHQDMLNIYDKSAEIGYRPSYFLRMVNEHGGVKAAHRLLASDTSTKGFQRLLEDVQRFGNLFAEQQADMFADDSRLQRYRQLAVLFYLRDELFVSILPRIKRRLSFIAPHNVQNEPLPPRGRIDWPRTIATGLRDAPGQPTLNVVTRQRRRNFATPENLLTVVTLLEYCATAQHLLASEALHNQTQALRHPLHDIVTSCNRELAFPQFAGLERESAAILHGHTRPSVAELTTTVRNNLLPGRNNAYDDLLAWRERLAALHLLDRTALQATPMLGSDPQRDNYLYQLWLFYEIGDVLQQQGCLQDWDVRHMRLTFTWGTGAEEQTYNLQHDQSIRQHWQNAPGVRPDLYLVRADRQEVRDGERLVWREPGFVLDAKYYRPQSAARTPGEPVKRMLADMLLSGERDGALLFAFQSAAQEEAEPDNGDELLLAQASQTITSPHQPLYTVTPDAVGIQTAQPDMQVEVWRIQPALEEHAQRVQECLQHLLEHAHQRLKNRVDIRCRGVFLDSLSATAHGDMAAASDLLQRDGTAIQESIEDLLFCPKPHIGAWRVDLVRLQHDCCINPHLCHIMQQADAHQPQRLTTLQDIEQAIRTATASETDDPEEQIAAATRMVQTIVRRYAQLLQPDITRYRAWIRDKLDIGDLFDTTPLLNETQRETLALARFLWEQIDHIKTMNFAAPTILFSGVLEEVTQGTIYDCCEPLCTTGGKPLLKTLGTLGNSKGYGGSNWRILVRDIVDKQYWHKQVSPQQTLTLSTWIDNVQVLSKKRNDAAHTGNLGSGDFDAFVRLYFGGAGSGYGLLNGLLLAWRGLQS